MERPSSAAETKPAASTWQAGLAVGVAAAAVFLLLTSLRIDAQGPQYDELHQVTGSFTWLGSPPELFCKVAFRRTCLLNMHYSGAIKTNLYGAYLRVSGQGFTVLSWRLFGILAVATAIILFGLIAHPAIPPWGIAIFFALLATDINVLLTTRFDFGPVALALVARLLLLALWIRGDAGPDGPTLANSFMLGAITGVAVVEKLSSVVLIMGLMIAIALGNEVRRTRRHLITTASGLTLGLLPLMLLNGYSVVFWGQIISMADAGPTGPPRSVGHFLTYVGQYLSLGRGPSAQNKILGVGAASPGIVSEALAVAVAAVMIGIATVKTDASRRLRLAGACMATYGAIGIALYLLPRRVYFHHQILGTPYQYASVVVGLVALTSQCCTLPRRRWLGVGLAIFVAGWLGLRLPAVWTVETHLVQGAAAVEWDVSLRDIGLFAAAHADNAIFIASDWGVATQIYSFANGRPGLVYEPFWHYEGVAQLRAIQEKSGKDTLYLVRFRPRNPVQPDATTRIELDLANNHLWREIEPEPETQQFTVLSVRKFEYHPSVGPSFAPTQTGH